MSERMKEYQREFKRKRRDRLLAQGLCTNCGKAPLVPGFKMCEPCREYHREKNRRHYREKREEEAKQPVSVSTLCFDCVNAVPTPDGTRGCEWSRCFRPVPGWEAKRNDVRIQSGNTNPPVRMVESYRVRKCPKFTEG